MIDLDNTYENKYLSLCEIYVASFFVIALLNYTIDKIYKKIYLIYDKRSSWNITSIIFFIFISSYGIYYSYDVLIDYITNLLYFDIHLINIKLKLDFLNSTPYFYNHLYIVSYLVSYFMYDLLFNKLNRDFIFHHIMILGSLVLYVLSEKYTFYVYILIMTEISSIFLTLTHLANNNIIKKIYIVLFVITFFLIRLCLVGITLLIIFRFESYSDKVVLLPPYISIYLLNLYWFRLIVKKAYTDLFYR